MAKAKAYFKTKSKYESYRLGTETTFVPTQGLNGPELAPMTTGKIAITRRPTLVTEERSIERLRRSVMLNRVFMECKKDGSPIGSAAVEPEPQVVSANDVTDLNGAIAFLSAVDGFDPDRVKDSAGRISYHKVKKFAKENGIVFPNYGS